MDRSPAAITARVEDLVARCRARGMPVTPQRLAIFRALLAAQDHPSAEMLYQRVRTELPTLSVATVYKVLETFTDLGVAREVPVLNDCRRFDANVARHHHMVCTTCKQVTDLYDVALDEVKPPPAARGFRAHEVSVQILGTCASCARAVRATPP